MSNKLDLRQSIYRGTLNQIASQNNPEGDNLLNSINSQLTPLLRLKATNPSSLVVNVENGDITDSETNYRRAIPHVGSTYLQFSSGTITFPSSPTGNIVCTPGGSTSINIPTSHFAAVLIYLDANGNLNVLVGTTSASENTAIQNLPPPPDETLAIGFVVIRNVSGTIQNIAQNKIAQFGTGSGGGSGSGGLPEESIALRNSLDGSYFKYLTTSIFSSSEKTTLIDTVNTTATFNLITKTYNFTSGQTIRSLDLIDESFYEEARDIDEAMFTVFWDKDNVDTNATYQLSRDNGVTWQTVTMTRNGLSPEYSGIKKFTAETLSTAGTITDTVDQVLNITTAKKISQRLILSETRIIKEITVKIKKTGSPSGNIIVKLVKNSGGNPSLNAADLIAVDEKSIASLSSGIGTYTFNFGLQVLKAGTYHLVFETNSDYESTFSSGTTEIAIRSDSAGSDPVAKSYNGTNWSDITGQSIKFSYTYKVLKLLARITSSASCKLKGFGVLYLSDPKFISPVSYMDIIVGSQKLVDAGLATHSSIANAISDAGSNSKIKILKGSYNENITISSTGLIIEGEGRGTIINGTVTYSATAKYNVLSGVKILNNVTFNASSEFNTWRDIWIDSGAVVTDNGIGNELNYIQET